MSLVCTDAIICLYMAMYRFLNLTVGLFFLIFPHKIGFLFVRKI